MYQKRRPPQKFESPESLAAVGSDASAPPRRIQGGPLHKLLQADKSIQTRGTKARPPTRKYLSIQPVIVFVCGRLPLVLSRNVHSLRHSFGYEDDNHVEQLAVRSFGDSH